ncbi:MAG: prepilin peptidase [Candidatus Bathyarchaeota archaeon]|nr:prepilin peptidase [Candidatus Bathyarchaeota archaeon]
MQLILAAARVTVTLVFLLYSSWSDYKTREVSNKVWALYAPMALTLSLVEFTLYDQTVFPTFTLSVILTIVSALLLFYTGAFGGADSKAFICIALALPVFPKILLKPLLPNGLSPISQTMFPLTVLSSSVLIAATSGLYLLLSNIAHRFTTGKPLFQGTLASESLSKKLLVLITGKKFSLKTLKEKWHIYPLEDINETADQQPQLQRKLTLVPHDEGRDNVLERLSTAVAAGQIDDDIWATPGLPMLIFVTVGLIMALTLGDVIWFLVSLLLT